MLTDDLRSLIQQGALDLRLGNGRTPLGAGAADAPVSVRIRDNATLWRIVRHPGLAVGEAYMEGALTIERGDLYDLLLLAQGLIAELPTKRVRVPRNTQTTSKRNVAHHYDLSGALYRLFLDADLQYSCAYFAHPGMTADQAQAAKKRHLAAKLLLQPGCSVLDIGSGWGGLALTLAEEYGADVTGITLSEEQLKEAQARVSQRRLDYRARFLLQDYREIEGVFDRVVSVGMFEHVGPAHYSAFFDAVAARLKPDGVALLHTIGKTSGPGPNNAWIEKYIFPGGVIPSLSQIAPAVERAGLLITDIEVLRLHYADTLRAWRERFAEHRDEARALYDERFCRMWEFYLAGAEAGFRAGDLVVFQIQMAKDKSVVPQTRDYITDFDRATPAFAVAAE